MKRRAELQNWRWRWRVSLAGLLAFMSLCLASLPGWGFVHASLEPQAPTRTFKVAELLLSSSTQVNSQVVPYWNQNPWLLPVLTHSPYKPSGWVFTNPLASSTLPVPLDAMLLNSGVKYSQLPTNVLANNWYTNGKSAGAALSKDDPAYWVVKLDQTNLDALAKFDILILDGDYGANLTTVDQNNIQYLLEHGATIWINNSQLPNDNEGSLYPPITFQSPATPPYQLMQLIKADPTNWLLNADYQLTDQEVSVLHDHMSQTDYISAGVAGFGNSANSMIQSVVNLYCPATLTINPAIAVGRYGNGLVVVSAVNLINAAAGWWENWHNNQTPWSLDMWPYARSLTDFPGNAGQPNFSDRYIASAKLIFNMFDRPANWNMAGGNPGATRAVTENIPIPLTRGWTTNFTAIGDPVTQDNYLAVTGYSTSYSNQTVDPTLAYELRVYRTRRVTDDAGTILDYPFGLYTQNNYYLTTSLLSSPAWWSSYYPLDAESGGGMDLCFSAPIPTYTASSTSWVGSPIFGKITLKDSNTNLPYSATVLYALQRYTLTSNGVTSTIYAPRCYLIDPYNLTVVPPNGQQVINPYYNAVGQADTGQVGFDLWNYSAATLSDASSGFARASMTLSHNHLIITTLGEASGNATRIYMLDAATGQPAVSLGASSDWPASFRFTGPASEVAAQIDYQASSLEAGANNGALTSANANLNAQDLRRDVVNVLAVSGEYYSASLNNAGNPTGQAALFLIPPTLTVKAPVQYGAFSGVPADLRISTSPNMTAAFALGTLNSQFRQDNILSIKYSGTTLKFTFRSWDLFFTQGTSPPILSLPLYVAYTPTNTIRPRPGLTSRSPIQVNELSMGYPILLQGTQVNDDSGQITLHLYDNDGVSTFGYLVDSPPLIYNNQAIVGTNSYVTTGLPSLASTTNSQTLSPMNAPPLPVGGTLTAVRLTHPGFSSYIPPMHSPYNGDLAFQFHGDTQGPKDTSTTNHVLSGLNQYQWHSDFPYPAAASKDTIFTTARYKEVGDLLAGLAGDMVETPATQSPIPNLQPQQCGMLYALDPMPSRYLQQVLTVGTPVVNNGFNVLGYQDPQSRVTFKGLFSSNTYAITISSTGNPNQFQWQKNGGAWSTPQNIDTTDQNMDGNVTVAFPQIYGYTTGNTWIINPTPTADPGSAAQLRQLLVSVTGDLKNALTPGKRTLLRYQPQNQPQNAQFYYTWDMGAIVSVRKDIATSNYWVTFDRDRLPDTTLINAPFFLMVATSVPYVSYVRGWNAVTGEEPIREYYAQNGAVTATRMSAGMTPTPPGLPVPATWQANASYSIGMSVQPTTPNGYFYSCTVAGMSGATEPSWPTTGSIANGSVTWITSTTWQANTSYNAGQIIQPTTANGYYYTCIVPGLSGTTQPNWPTSGFITDGNVAFNGSVLTWAGTLITPPVGKPPVANPMMNPPVLNQPMMIEFLSQAIGDATPAFITHNINPLSATGTATPFDDITFDLLDWQQYQHWYLRPLATQMQVNPATISMGLNLNYTVDYLTGRILLSPQVAGEFADRFVQVYYYTNDLVSGATQKTFHAEIMHVPSQIKWEYQFLNALPDGGPMVVHDTVFVAANRKNSDNSWEPVIYAFPANPVNTGNVQPLWVQPLGVRRSGTALAWMLGGPGGNGYAPFDLVTGTDGMIYSCIAPNGAGAWTQPVIGTSWSSYWSAQSMPYRWVTATPTPSGILVGTAIPWSADAWSAGQTYNVNDTAVGTDTVVYHCITAHTADATNRPTTGANWNRYWQVAANQLTAFTNQGLVVADGHRVLHINPNGVVDRQTGGTLGYDPTAVGNAANVATNPTSYPAAANTAAASLVQQDFTLLTRLHQLPNGDTLVCDTGGNRVVQFDHTGTITWQYPDSDLNYQDPDQVYGSNTNTPARAATLSTLQIPTPASLRINDPRDARRYVHDVCYTPQVLSAVRTGNITTLTTTALPVSTGPLNITVEGVRTITNSSNFNGKFVAWVSDNTHLQYTQTDPNPNDTAIAQLGIVVTDKLVPETVAWNGYTLTANIRWESTLIADTGNNRILEVDRPLVRFINPATGLDLQQIPNTNPPIMLALGYHYRPDVTYGNPAKPLQQQTEVLADANTLALVQTQTGMPNTLFGKPLMFTSALRYGDSENVTIPAQLDNIDPIMSCVRTGELLATVSNLVPDPYTANIFIRTVHLSRPLVLLSEPSQGQPGDALYPNTLFTIHLAAAGASGTTVNVSSCSALTVGTTVAISNGVNPSETATISNINVTSNVVTLAKPLQYTYTQATGVLIFPEPALLMPHPAAPTVNALLKTSLLTTLVNAGNVVIPVQNAAKFLVGEQVGIAYVPYATPGATPPIPVGQPLGIIQSIDAVNTPNTVTVTTPLPTNYNNSYALYAFGQGRDEYAQVRQLDLVILQNPTEVHTLVVDQAGIREVSTDPANQGDVAFEMTPTQYSLALQDPNWANVVPLKYPTASFNQQTGMETLLSAWLQPPNLYPAQPLPTFLKDAGFNPVSVLRLEPRPRATTDNATIYQQQVQYLIGQMNEKNAPWNNDQALRRTHLFTARWVPGVGNGWAMVDADANYFIYPDPLSPGFPNLPGMTYPLSEPFGVDLD